jgi:hypothetical protein
MPTQNLPGGPPVKPTTGIEDSYLPLKATRRDRCRITGWAGGSW